MRSQNTILAGIRSAAGIVPVAWRKVRSVASKPFRAMMEENAPPQAADLEAARAIHNAYCAATGLSVNFEVHFWTYSNLIHFGYTPDDVAVVINHIKWENRRHEYKRSLSVSKVIGDVERFDETLAQARAVARNRVQHTSRDQALREWRGAPPPVDGKTNCVSIKEALLSAINGNGSAKSA